MCVNSSFEGIHYNWDDLFTGTCRTFWMLLPWPVVNSFRARHREVNHIKSWMFFYQFTFQNAKARHSRTSAGRRMWLSFYATHNCKLSVKVSASTKKSWTTVCSLFSRLPLLCLSKAVRSTLNPVTPKEFLFFLLTYIIYLTFCMYLYAYWSYIKR